MGVRRSAVRPYRDRSTCGVRTHPVGRTCTCQSDRSALILPAPGIGPLRVVCSDIAGLERGIRAGTLRGSGYPRPAPIPSQEARVRPTRSSLRPAALVFAAGIGIAALFTAMPAQAAPAAPHPATATPAAASALVSQLGGRTAGTYLTDAGTS